MSAVAPHPDLTSRISFLHKAVDDTQATIRFIDTKAAFFVTLQSGMVAIGLQASRGEEHHPWHGWFQGCFLLAIGATLALCMRVIFPVIKPHTASAAHPSRKLPKFFIHKRKQHHPLRHLLTHEADNVLVDDHESYTRVMAEATDEDLMLSLSDTLLTVSLIRQIKSDRLHMAMYTLSVSITLFIVMVLT